MSGVEGGVMVGGAAVGATGVEAGGAAGVEAVEEGEEGGEAKAETMTVVAEFEAYTNPGDNETVAQFMRSCTCRSLLVWRVILLYSHPFPHLVLFAARQVLLPLKIISLPGLP